MYSKWDEWDNFECFKINDSEKNCNINWLGNILMWFGFNLCRGNIYTNFSCICVSLVYRLPSSEYINIIFPKFSVEYLIIFYYVFTHDLSNSSFHFSFGPPYNLYQVVPVFRFIFILITIFLYYFFRHTRSLCIFCPTIADDSVYFYNFLQFYVFFSPIRGILAVMRSFLYSIDFIDISIKYWNLKQKN